MIQRVGLRIDINGKKSGIYTATIQPPHSRDDPPSQVQRPPPNLTTSPPSNVANIVQKDGRETV